MVCSLLFASPDVPHDVSLFDPASPSGKAIATLFVLVVAVCVGIFLLVELTLIYSLIRFRRRPTDAASEPPQVYGSLPVEIAWTTAPALIVFLFALAIFRGEGNVRSNPEMLKPNAQRLHVTVVGHQWWWEYRYEDFHGEQLGFVTANELVIPVSDAETPRPVHLTLKSADVCHSFWVPRLAGKTDLIPGRTNTMAFMTDKEGLYLGQCAEYCGTQHAHMLLRVEVVPLDKFRAWLADQRKPAATPADKDTRRGRDVFLKTACVNCHTVRDTLAKGKFGPDLTHLMSRQTLAAGMVKNDPDKLHQWVVDPNVIKAGCLMPAMKLSDADVGLVVQYLRSLK